MYKANNIISKPNEFPGNHSLPFFPLGFSWQILFRGRLASFVWPMIDISYSCLCKHHLPAAIPFPSLPKKKKKKKVIPPLIPV